MAENKENVTDRKTAAQRKEQARLAKALKANLSRRKAGAGKSSS